MIISEYPEARKPGVWQMKSRLDRTASLKGFDNESKKSTGYIKSLDSKIGFKKVKGEAEEEQSYGRAQ